MTLPTSIWVKSSDDCKPVVAIVDIKQFIDSPESSDPHLFSFMLGGRTNPKNALVVRGGWDDVGWDENMTELSRSPIWEDNVMLGESVQDAINFIANVESGVPTSVRFRIWIDDWEEFFEEGDVVFTGTHFLLPVFDAGRFGDAANVVLENQHLADLANLKKHLMD